MASDRLQICPIGPDFSAQGIPFDNRAIVACDGGITMAEKSARKTTAKPAARSLKEKRADKKAKSDRQDHSADIVSNVKKK
jgi:hypothetical protein